jgi:hypothetical protein
LLGRFAGSPCWQPSQRPGLALLAASAQAHRTDGRKGRLERPFLCAISDARPALRKQMSARRMGNGLDEGTEMGPLIDERQRGVGTGT